MYRSSSLQCITRDKFIFESHFLLLPELNVFKEFPVLFSFAPRTRTSNDAIHSLHFWRVSWFSTCNRCDNVFVQDVPGCFSYWQYSSLQKLTSTAVLLAVIAVENCAFCANQDFCRSHHELTLEKYFANSSWRDDDAAFAACDADLEFVLRISFPLFFPHRFW